MVRLSDSDFPKPAPHPCNLRHNRYARHAWPSHLPYCGRDLQSRKNFPTREPNLGYVVSDLSTILLPWVAWNAERSTPPFLFSDIADGPTRGAFQHAKQIAKSDRLKHMNKAGGTTTLHVIGVAVGADGDAVDPTF